MLVAGFVVQGGRGPVLIGVGLVLGALAGLELSIREHFAGYRSHTLVLSGALAVAVLGGARLSHRRRGLAPPGARRRGRGLRARRLGADPGLQAPLRAGFKVR